MRRLTLLVGLVLAVGVLLPGSAVADQGGSNLPLKGFETGYTTADLATGQAHAVSSGPNSHFGLTTTEQQFQLVPTGPGNFTWFGTWTSTAANGDQMFGTSTGSVIYTDSVHSTSLGIYTSTGGTGRFADASLSLEATGHNTIVSVAGTTATISFEVTLDGQLSY